MEEVLLLLLVACGQCVIRELPCPPSTVVAIRAWVQVSGLSKPSPSASALEAASPDVSEMQAAASASHTASPMLV